MQDIKALTSLRGVAAMAVVMQHFSATAQTLCDVSIPSLVPHGYMAVDLFFVLSGFIMSYTYLAAFNEVGIRAFPGFIAKRVARVMPLNIAVLLSLMLLGAISLALLDRNIFFKSDDLSFDLTANLLLLQGIGIGTNLNGPSWSISTEFAAYLLFPIFVALLFHRASGVWIFALVVSVGMLSFQAFQHPRLGLASEMISDQVIRCFTEFAIGMASYRLFRQSGAASILGTDVMAFSLAVAMLGCLALRVDLPFALLCPFLIASLAHNQGQMDKLMSGRLVYFLGVISYSVYLIHNMFRPVWVEAIRAMYGTPLSPATALLLALAGSLSVIPFAWLAYTWIERPGRSIVRRFLQSSQ